MTLKSINSLIFGILALSLLTACAQNRDFAGRNTVNVLVMAEDEDGASLPRSSTIHKRIIAKVKSQLQRQGFTVKDDDYIAADLGMTFHDRMSKRDIVEAVKMMNQSSSRNKIRALALVRVMGRSQQLSFANAVNVRLEGEVYDVLSNRYIGSFDTPVKKFSAPSDCDMPCAIQVISRETGSLADDLGSALSRKLGHFVDNRQISTDTPNSSSSSSNSYTGSSDEYVFNLVGFNTEEALEILRVMSREFPGYKSHDLISRGNRQWSYEYRSKASFAKLEKWINILLLDMGYNPDQEVDIRFSNNQFTLNLKAAKMNNPTGSNTGTGRFH